MSIELDESTIPTNQLSLGLVEYSPHYTEIKELYPEQVFSAIKHKTNERGEISNKAISMRGVSLVLSALGEKYNVEEPATILEHITQNPLNIPNLRLEVQETDTSLERLEDMYRGIAIENAALTNILLEFAFKAIEDFNQSRSIPRSIHGEERIRKDISKEINKKLSRLFRVSDWEEHPSPIHKELMHMARVIPEIVSRNLHKKDSPNTHRFSLYEILNGGIRGKKFELGKSVFEEIMLSFTSEGIGENALRTIQKRDELASIFTQVWNRFGKYDNTLEALFGITTSEVFNYIPESESRLQFHYQPDLRVLIPYAELYSRLLREKKGTEVSYAQVIDKYMYIPHRPDMVLTEHVYGSKKALIIDIKKDLDPWKKEDERCPPHELHISDQVKLYASIITGAHTIMTLGDAFLHAETGNLRPTVSLQDRLEIERKRSYGRFGESSEEYFFSKVLPHIHVSYFSPNSDGRVEGLNNPPDVITYTLNKEEFTALEERMTALFVTILYQGRIPKGKKKLPRLEFASEG